MANIIFDFDGTIADSFEYVLGFLCKEAGKPADYAVQQADEYRHLAMKDIALKLGIPFWKLPYVYFKGRRVMRQHVLHVRPFPGVPELINTLASGGHRLSIISANSTKNVRIFLREHKLDSDFQIVRGGAGILGKVRPIRQLKQRFKAEECWYVGDEVTDMLSAKAAGVRSLGVTWGFASHDELTHAGAEVIVDTPNQILKAIQA